MRTHNQIERKVRRILEKAGVRTPPIDVVALAERFGAEIRPEIAPDDVSGGLYRIEDRPVIGVNAAHHPNRQRFTIAHELGHMLLHNQDEFVDHGYVVEASLDPDPQFKRSRLSSEAVDSREIEANRFAASLLMPADFVLREIRLLPVPIRSEAVEELARKFKVSQQAMTFRLQNMKTPLDQV